MDARDRKDTLELMLFSKIRDSKLQEGELRTRRTSVRKTIEYLVGGPNSRRYKNIIRSMKGRMVRFRESVRKKNVAKHEHLRKKYGVRNAGFELPEALERYGDCEIFSEQCKLAAQELKGPVVVEDEDHKVELTEDEIAFLTKGPSYCTYKVMDRETFLHNAEVALVKHTWDRMQTEDQETVDGVEMSVEEQERIEETEKTTPGWYYQSHWGWRKSPRRRSLG